MELQNVNSNPNMETCPLDLSNYGFLDPYFSLNNNILYPEIYTPFLQQFDFGSSSYQCPKHQKLVQSSYCADQNQNSAEPPKKNPNCVSMQSIAARERRRKISGKTQELAKLVPGGNRMNAAEMLHAAFKYVKFLQAQLGILQFMDSFLEIKKAIDEENMQIVTSPKVQEKLYMEDKCLVPKDVVLSLTSLSKSSLSAELSDN